MSMTATRYLKIRKFESFKVNKPETPKINSEKVVINLSDRNFSTEEQNVLAKEGNYAVTPKEIPKEQIIANIETAIRTLPEEQAVTIRTETSCILRKAKPPKRNLTNKEFRALKDLNTDENILILPADKGNATVVMNTTDYEYKIEELLDPSTYK